jgi:hypothetical protein
MLNKQKFHFSKTENKKVKQVQSGLVRGGDGKIKGKGEGG